MLSIVRIAAGIGISRVRITGGEPLIRRGVCEFIAFLVSTAGLDDISITTNGTLTDFAERLFASGVKRINISLGSLNAEKYARITRSGDLKAVLFGIAAVHRIGFSPIKINTVVIRGFNEDEIWTLRNLASTSPIR